MTAKDDLEFLSYFIRSYIPPYTNPIPTTEKEYKKIFIRSYEIWGHLRKTIDRMPIAYDIKKKMFELFNFSKEIWMTYLLTVDLEPYNRLIMKQEIRDKWKKMERLAINIENYYKGAPEFN